MKERRLIYAATLLRATATGAIAVLLAIYLAKRGFAPAESGIIIGAGLTGAAAAGLLATLWGDHLGRRRLLIAVALVSACGAAGLVLAESFLAALAAAFVGMVNGMGRDRGASLILDQSILVAGTRDHDRTLVLAWYNMLQDVGCAVGGLVAGLPVLVRGITGYDELTSLRAVIAAYVGLYVLTAVLYTQLTQAAELASANKVVLTPQSRRILLRITALFAFDSLAGGFLTSALVAYFFYERFGVSEGVVGLLFFGARLANAASHFGAAWLAKRIGLVRTMVFTHTPSSLLLITVAFVPNFPIAAALFLVREGLVEMDVPTRQSYVMAMVRPEERTFAAGVTNLVRVGAWAIGPVVAGALMQGASLALPLVVGASMKVLYDVLLYRAFRHVPPPEERAAICRTP